MADRTQQTVYSEAEQSQQTQADVLVVKKNSRGRIIMVIMGAFVLIALAFGAMSLFGKKKPVDADATLPAAGSIGHVPGGPKSTPNYTKLQEEENAGKAQQEGTTLPVLTTDQGTQVGDPFPETDPIVPVVETPVTDPAAVPVVAVPVATTPVQQVPVVAAPVGPQYTTEQYASMATALQGYIEAWQVAPTPAQEFSFNGQAAVVSAPNGANAPAAIGQASSPGIAPGGSTSIDATASGKKGPSFVRAGTVIPATLLSVIDSDNPGPILAQITSGPLAGTRLLGQFQSTGKALLLNFTTLSRPGMATYSVNVVAVDENYASGMKTDVNNHYLRRYGLLIAASFLQGYGEAIGRANTTVVTGPFGSTVTQGPLTSEQARQVAIGQVGGALTQNLMSESKVPPTVKLDCGGGCPVGLLFLSDL